MRSQLPSAWGWLLLTLGVLAVLPVILAFAAYRYRPRLSAERLARRLLLACLLSPLLQVVR